MTIIRINRPMDLNEVKLKIELFFIELVVIYYYFYENC